MSVYVCRYVCMYVYVCVSVCKYVCEFVIVCKRYVPCHGFVDPFHEERANPE